MQNHVKDSTVEIIELWLLGMTERIWLNWLMEEQLNGRPLISCAAPWPRNLLIHSMFFIESAAKIQNTSKVELYFQTFGRMLLNLTLSHDGVSSLQENSGPIIVKLIFNALMK